MLTLITGKEINGRYVIQGCVGTGGYGSVFRAADKQLNRDVALKRLLKTGTTQGENVDVLLAEARKHAQLVHTNIVQVYDVIECEGEHLIVMEFIDGSSLQSILRDHALKGDSIPLDNAVSLLADVLKGVAFAHEKQIVHRDLGPSNILIAATGVPKIGDFGIATLVPGTPGASSASVHGGTGNANYMAPEQQRGEGVDQSSDLFTVGIVGYLLLTGRHPFTHPSGLFGIPELIGDLNFQPETPKPPTVLTTSQQRLFREYAAIVMRLLNRERAGRFSSAREALEAIEAVTPFQECPHCGERLPEHFRFCGYCGKEVAAAQPSPTPAPADSDATADDLIEEGYLLSRERRWDDAIARYQRALKLEPENQKAFRNLGFALNRVRRHDEAVIALSKGLALHAEFPEHEASLRYERAVARTELKEYDSAMEDVGRALALEPRSTKALYLRAKISLYRGSLSDARRDAVEVLRAIPDHNGAIRLLDQIDRRTGLEPNKRLQPTGV